MTRAPKTVTEDETVGRAAREILAHRYVNLPVVDERGCLVGLFGIYDLLALLMPRVAAVGDLMPNLRFMSDDLGELHERFAELKDTAIQRAINREPVVVHADTPIIEAVRLFCQSHMTIPVVDEEDRRLRGIISYWDAGRAITGITE